MSVKAIGFVLLVALLVGVVAGYWVASQGERERAAADQATIAGHVATIEGLKDQAATLDTVMIHQTDTLTRIRTRWDSVRVVERFTDSLVRVDTLRLVVRVADSVIQACGNVLATCEQRTGVLRQVIAADSTMIRALSRDLARAKVRNRLGCTLGPGGTTKGFDYVAVACGLRIF